MTKTKTAARATVTRTKAAKPASKSAAKPAPKRPTKKAPKLSYTETLTVQGVSIPFVPAIITPRIERPMRAGRYEGGEVMATRDMVRAGDRVLELGGGVGLVSTVAAQVPGVEKVVTIEANPDLLPLIRETHRINGVENVELRNGVVVRKGAGPVNFYLRPDFWASSMEPDSRPYDRVVSLYPWPLADLIAELRPTVISADIEGGEIEVFDGIALDGVRVIIIELHPAVYGKAGEQRILDHLASLGFNPDERYLAGSVWVLSREIAKPAVVAPVGQRGLSDPAHDTAEPRFAIATCMKNEGPFILEWLAYHRAIGVQDFVVFTNDCTDGSDRLLDRLDEMGVVTHLPNPAVVAGSTFFQPLAMKYTVQMPVIRRADYFIQTDVDEFITIRAGKGHLRDLLKAAGPFHVLSISEVNFNSSGQWDFADTWITETFREHETFAPGHWQARRGVKSIIHGIDNFASWPVHRPGAIAGLEDRYVWLDGSGRQVPAEFITKHENGIDRRGRYELVQLDHHPIRSVQSYLMKFDRGDVVTPKRNVDHHYFRRRSIGGQSENHIARMLPKARAEWAALMRDGKVADLHRQTVAAHEARIAEIETRPERAELREWIRATYFPGRAAQ